MPLRSGPGYMPPRFGGAIAQLGERLNGIQEVVGSIPIGSTNSDRGRALIWPKVSLSRIPASLFPTPVGEGCHLPTRSMWASEFSADRASHRHAGRHYRFAFCATFPHLPEGTTSLDNIVTMSFKRETGHFAAPAAGKTTITTFGMCHAHCMHAKALTACGEAGADPRTLIGFGVAATRSGQI